MIRVVIGSGGSENNAGWLHTEESELSLLVQEDWENRFEFDSIGVILAEHVWEHLTYDEGIQAAKICFKYLKHGGYIRCAVPDGFFPNEAYQNIVKVGGPGPKDHPAASHKIVHTFLSIQSMFEEAGYEVQLLEYCDDNGNFHYNEWDETKGFIYRSKRFDHRNKDGQLGFVSLIIDARKPNLSPEN
ncbi:class I SAM-dependent methyltransferase [Paenibacillus mendelii]|uniref:SAM-dependent methyltransferase n=1 Tax=Paenibacillus mendelii TaxID=206163 RepID=A0ABV6JAL4_9BACL|nr:SAM-dependent methyltransferase [Paenibacillus mendelii]MCQ6564116.1 SAM-dependent methyltransferase [Paenibacillus mendelii]